ncbi:hypothetical protein F5Y18DRAFT_427217 [Xylariaceae sp. FL1019]|nr:hypothetical protein F5Y18DRAFT_427217 [Xylariaceae sp. FL1019]
MSSADNQPSLVGGHAEYIKGASSAAIGDITGSQACKRHTSQMLTLRWNSKLCAEDRKASGEQAKAHAVDTMKAASENRDASQQGFGKVEQKLGEVTGCEGMASEGAASKKQ